MKIIIVLLLLCYVVIATAQENTSAGNFSLPGTVLKDVLSHPVVLDPGTLPHGPQYPGCQTMILPPVIMNGSTQFIMPIWNNDPNQPVLTTPPEPIITTPPAKEPIQAQNDGNWPIDV